MAQPFLQSVANVWDEWDVRVVVLGSLCVQIFLILYGSRRKYTADNRVRIFVWMAYLSADWVATFSLGMISRFRGSDALNTQYNNRKFILALWAPFLLLHLGGPDTITAYAMEDNDLWLRHLLSLLVQVSLAVYVFLRSWTATNYLLPLLETPILVAGTIKYAERSWVLRSVSKKIIDRNMVIRIHKNINSNINPPADQDDEARFLHETGEFFAVVTVLYKDLADSRTCKATSYWSYLPEPASPRQEDSLKQVEFVLGFMYDVLYTKATLVYSSIGIVFRCFSLNCCIATFLAFSLFIDKKLYPGVDIIITYLLLIGAIILELYAIVVILLTDWTQYWLRSSKQKCSRPLQLAVSSLRSKLSYDKKWSETVAKFNLIDFCTKQRKPPCARISQVLGVAESVEMEWHMTLEDVPKHLKQLIFKQVIKARRQNAYVNDVLGWRGDHALRENGCFRELSWTIRPQSYGRSIMLWHIATDLCFYDDSKHRKFQECSAPPADNSMYSKLSMLLSDHMAYVIIMRRFLLPGSNFVVDCLEYRLVFKEFFENRVDLLMLSQLQNLSQVQGYQDVVPLAYEMGNTAKVDLRSDARHYLWRTWLESIRLAQQIQLLEAQGKLTNADKWKMITEVWIETFCHAALQCPWSAHAQQLRRGGELLTYVYLLMAKLGINNAFRELGGG